MQGRVLFPHPDKLLLVVLSINGSVGDRYVAKINLHSSDVIAIIDHIETAAMPEHVRVHAGQGGVVATLLYEFVHGATGEGASTFGYKEPGELGFTLAKVTAQKPQLISGHRVHPVDPILGSLHKDSGLFQVQLVELDAAQLRNAQPVTVEHKNDQLVTSGISGLLCGLVQGI